MNNDSNINVLVIDDSFVNRQFIKALLEQGFMIVSEAGNGSEALDIMATHKPDLIILDLMMPIMGGIETLQNIRNQGYNFPIIVLTADIDGEARQKCIDLGVAGFVYKPANGKELIKIVKTVVTNQMT